MSRRTFSDFNKEHSKVHERSLKHQATMYKQRADRDRKEGHIASDLEIAGRNRDLFELSQSAAELRQNSNKKSQAYKQAASLLKSAVNSENRYRTDMSRNIQRRQQQEAPRDITGQNSYFNRMQNMANQRAVTQNQTALEQQRRQQAEQDAFVRKYGDLNTMSADELRNRIKNLEQRKLDNQARRATDGVSAQSTNLGNSPSLPSGLINEQKRAEQQVQRLTPAQREHLDRDDAFADDFLEVYKKALPDAIRRDEEKKLTLADKKKLWSAADVLRKDVQTEDGKILVADAKIDANKKARDSVEYLKKRGVDVDYLLESYGTQLDNEDAERTARDFKEWSSENWLNGVLGSVGTVIASPFTGLTSAAEDIRHAVRNTGSEKPTQINQKNRGLTNYTQAVREGVSENIKSPVWNFIYNAGMSTADSAAALAAGGALGAAGMGSKAATTITQSIMSVNAADQTYDEAIERGLDPMRAMATAITAGVAEWVTEKYSIDGLKSMALNRPDKLRTLVKNIGKQMITEGSEEAASDVINTIGDNIINGKKSQFEQSVKEYKNQGLTSEQARKAAMMDWLGNTAYDAAAGAFSGALMGVGAQGASFKQTRSNISDYGVSIAKAGEISSVIDYAKKFSGLEKQAGKADTDLKVGQLAEAVEKKVNDRISKAETVEELEEAYEDLKKDAPDTVGIQIDTAVRNKAIELSDTAEEEKRDAAERLVETSTDSLIERSNRMDEKITEANDEANNEQNRRETVLSQTSQEKQTDNAPVREVETERIDGQEVEKVEPKITGNQQATLIHSNEPVHIEGFVQTGVDDVKVKIDGETDAVSLSELKFDSPFVEKMYKSAATLDDAAAASAMISNFDGKQNISVYFENFEKAYNFGTVGLDLDTVMKKTPFAIPKNLVELAYDLGYNHQQETYEEPLRVNRMGEGTAVDLRDEIVKGDGYGDIDKALAKKLGVDIKLVDIAEDTNGEKNDKINGYLDIKNGRMVFSDVAESKLGVRVHESMEFVEAVTPKAYKQMMTTLLDYMAEESNLNTVYDMVMNYRDKYREAEGSKTFEEALGEFMNDAISGVFMNEQGAEDFIAWLHAKDLTETEEMSILQTIVKMIKSLVEKLKASLDYLTPAQKTTAKMQIKTQEKIEKMFMDAVDDASKVYRGEALEADQTEGQMAASRANSIRVKYKKEVPHEQGSKNIKTVYDVFVEYKEGKKREGKVEPNDSAYRYDIHKDEDEAARIVARDFGIDITLRNEVYKPHAKNPDYIMSNGELWDLKSPNSEEAAYNLVRSGIKQVWDNPGGIILNFSDNNIDEDLAWKRIENRINQSSPFGLDVIMIRNGKTVAARKYIVEKEAVPRPIDGRGSTSKDIITYPQENARENRRNSIKIDSEGRELSKEQQEFFGDTKTIDRDGRLLTLYHQTEGEFTVFDTRRKGAGSNDSGMPYGIFLKSTPKDIGLRGKNQMNLYANITNPLVVNNREELAYKISRLSPEYESLKAEYDATDKKYKEKADDLDNKSIEYLMKWAEENPDRPRADVYDDEEYKKIDEAEQKNIDEWGEEIDKISVKMKEVLTKCLRENGYDGVFISKDKGSFGRSTDAFIALDPAQVKSIDNKTPTKNPDIRFSLKVPVEETKDLVAVHNLSEEKLLNNLDMGGFPMPSIAITKKNMTHEGFGDISVVFRKDTINPENSDNAVYSADAYTARFPEIGYKINEDDLRELADKLGTSEASLEANGFNRASIKDIARGLGSMPEVMNSFIKEKNIKVTPAKKVPSPSILRETQEDANAVVYMMVNDYTFRDLVENKEARKGFIDAAMDLPENASSFLTKARTSHANMIEKYLDKAAESKEDFERIEKKFNKDLDILHGTAEEEDYEGGYRDGVRAAIKENAEAFEEYTTALAKSVRREKGIRNNKDRYTPDGSERDFEELHMKYTLDNLVKAMRSLGEEAVESASPYGMFSGASTDKLDSMEAIQREKGRIKEMSPEEYDDLTKQYAGELMDIAKSIANDPDDIYIVDGTAEGIVEALKKSKTKRGVLTALKEYADKATMDAVDKIFELKDKIRNMPTKYLEAKPRRAVGLDEIAGVAIPAGTSDTVKTRLDDLGIPYEEYDEYGGKSRVKAVNSFSGIHFSRKVDLRRSVEGGKDTTDLLKENEHLKAAVENLEKEFELTGGTIPDAKKIQTAAGRILRKYNSKFDKQTLVENITNVYKYLREDGADFEEATKVMSEIAKGVLEKSENVDTTMADAYKELRDQIRNEGVTLSEKQKEEVAYTHGSYGQYRKNNFGRMKLRKSGTTLDQQWQEWSSQYPELFPADTNEADMPAVLEGILDALKPQVETLNGETIDQMAYGVAMEIYSELSKVPPKETFADQKEKEKHEAMMKVYETMEDLVEAYRKDNKATNDEEVAEALEEVKKEKAKRQARIFSEIQGLQEAKKTAKNPKTLAEYKKAIEKKENEIKRIRATNDKKIAEVRAKYQGQRLKQADQRRMTETKDRIRKLHKKFRQMMMHPKKDMYIPAADGLMEAAVKVCETVNLGAAPGTVLFSELTDAKRQYDKLMKDEDYFGHEDFSPIVSDDLETVSDIFKPDSNTGESRTIYDLSASELEQVYECMNEIYTTIRNTTKLIRENGTKDAIRAGERIMKDLEDVKEVKKWYQKAGNAVSMKLLNPYRNFRRLAAYNDNSELMDCYEELNEGQRKMYRTEMEAEEKLQKFTGRKENKKFLEELDSKKGLVKVPLRFESGNAPVYITRGMRLELIMHGKSQANFDHMAHNGVMVPVEIEKYGSKKGKAYDKTRKIVGITRDALRQMEDSLSTQERELLKVMQDFFWNWSGEKINETSMELYGFKKARVERYYPIKVDSNFVISENSGLKMDKTIEGMGFLKERQKDVKPIVLSSIIDTAERTKKSTALFAGLAIPVRNFNKILNVTTYRIADAVDPTTTERVRVPDRTVKGQISQVWGKNADQFIEHLLQDLQQARRREYDLFDKIKSNYAGAVLTGNVSVIIKQTSAYPTCAAITGWSPTIKAMFRGGKNNWMLSRADQELINKYTPLYWYRNLGNNTQELSEIRDTNTLFNRLPPVEFVRNAIQKVDMAMVGRFWYAAQYYVDKQRPDLKKNKESNPDAYYTEVARVFNRTVEETQSTNMTLQNSEIMKSTNYIAKVTTLFMGQGLQNFGLVYDNIFNLKAKRKQFKEGKIDKSAVTQARKDLANAVSSQLVSAAMFAGLAIVVAMVLHKTKRYKDDDGEMTVESVLSEWGGDMAENIIGSVPLGNLAYDCIMSITGERAWGQEDVVLGAFNDVESSLVNLKKAIVDGKGIWDKVIAFGNSTSKLMGVPFENGVNLVKGAMGHIEDISSGNGFLSFESGTERTNAAWGRKIIQAIDEGNKDQVEIYIETLVDLGKTEDKITEIISNAMKEREDVIEAAEKKTTDSERYSEIKFNLISKGFPEAAFDKAVNSIRKQENSKPKEEPDTEAVKERMQEAGSLYEAMQRVEPKQAEYSGNDLVESVAKGDQKNIDAIVKAIVDDKVKSYGKEEGPKKAGTSIKTALTKAFKYQYNEGNASEKQKVMKLLQKVKIDGAPLYDQETFQKWYKESQK